MFLPQAEEPGAEVVGFVNATTCAWNTLLRLSNADMDGTVLSLGRNPWLAHGRFAYRKCAGLYVCVRAWLSVSAGFLHAIFCGGRGDLMVVVARVFFAKPRVISRVFLLCSALADHQAGGCAGGARVRAGRVHHSTRYVCVWGSARTTPCCTFSFWTLIIFYYYIIAWVVYRLLETGTLAAGSAFPCSSLPDEKEAFCFRSRYFPGRFSFTCLWASLTGGAASVICMSMCVCVCVHAIVHGYVRRFAWWTKIVEPPHALACEGGARIFCPTSISLP